MKVHHALPSVTGLVVLLAGAPLSAAPRLETLLPEDTRMVLLVEDVSAFRATWPESPLGKLWNDPAFREAAETGPGSGGSPLGRIHRATGLTALDLLNAFEDEAALCIPDLESLVSPQGSWAVIATSADDEPLRRLADRITGTDESGSTKLASRWENGVAFLGSPPAYVDLLVSSRATPGNHLDASAGWNELRTEAAEFRAYLDLGGIADLLTDKLAQSTAADSNTVQFLGITQESVVGAMGLEGLRSAGLGARLASDGVHVDAGLLLEDVAGLPRLFATATGPCGRPAAIPADAVAASVSRFRVTEFWTAFLEMVDRIQPGLSSLVTYQIGAVTQASGLDFDKDVLRQLGDEMFSAYLPPASAEVSGPAPGGFDQMSGITVKDPEKMATSIQWLIAGSPVGQEGRSETREFGGIPVHTFRIGHDPEIPSFSYAILESTLLVSGGAPEILDRAIEAAGTADGSLWDRPDLAPLLALVSPEASSVGFLDPRGLRDRTRPNLPADTTGQGEASGSSFARKQAAAEAVARHLGPILGYLVKTPSGLRGEARITAPTP